MRKTSNNTGGPAFPRPGYTPENPLNTLEPGERVAMSNPPQTGMTLLDHFAGLAMVSLLRTVKKGELPGVEVRREIARTAYEMARAMLRAREVS